MHVRACTMPLRTRARLSGPMRVESRRRAAGVEFVAVAQVEVLVVDEPRVGVDRPLHERTTECV